MWKYALRASDLIIINIIRFSCTNSFIDNEKTSINMQNIRNTNIILTSSKFHPVGRPFYSCFYDLSKI